MFGIDVNPEYWVTWYLLIYSGNPVYKVNHDWIIFHLCQRTTKLKAKSRLAGPSPQWAFSLGIIVNITGKLFRYILMIDHNDYFETKIILIFNKYIYDGM